MEGTGPERDQLSNEKRRTTGLVYEHGRGGTPFPADVPAAVDPGSERAHDQRGLEPPSAGSATGPRNRRRVGPGTPFARQDDAGTFRWSAPGRPQYLPTPARDAFRFTDPWARFWA